MNYKYTVDSSSFKVKSRKTHQQYKISQKDWHHIMDLVKFYHESIYLLPDFETICAEKLDFTGNTIDRCTLKVNEVVFT